MKDAPLAIYSHTTSYGSCSRPLENVPYSSAFPSTCFSLNARRSVQSWHSPVWNQRPFPSLDRSGGTYSDSVSFSVRHQQTCTARAQTALQRRALGEQIKGLLWHTDFKHTQRPSVCHRSACCRLLPVALKCTFSGRHQETQTSHFSSCRAVIPSPLWRREQQPRLFQSNNPIKKL